MSPLFRLLTLLSLLVCPNLIAQTALIAHRGHWTPRGSEQNTLESLRRAYDLRGVYGVEMDLQLTKDSVIILAHDPDVHGWRIDASNWRTLQENVTLRNGQKLATLDEFLELLTQLKGIHFVCEFKSQRDRRADRYLVRETFEKISAKGLRERVCYISFSLDICCDIVRRDPTALVLYLGGDKSPGELKSMGIRGINYHYSVYRKHPEWIDEAGRLGMTVGAWTINEPLTMYQFIPKIDILTTDMPEAALDIFDQLGIPPRESEVPFVR